MKENNKVKQANICIRCGQCQDVLFFWTSDFHTLPDLTQTLECLKCDIEYTLADSEEFITRFKSFMEMISK